MTLRIASQPTTDFTVLALENTLKLEKIYRESMMEIMTIEEEFIEGCLEMGQIVTEALDATEVEVKKKRGIFQRILDALEALFGTFKQKITILMDKNSEWLKANLVNINKESISKLAEVELIPFWTRTADAISNALQDITNNLINRTKASPEKYATMEELEKIVRQKIGGKDDLVSDCKNFFVTGKPNGGTPKPVKINGPSLAVYVDEMTSYVLEYDKIVVPKLNKFMNSVKTTVKGLQASTKLESFCFLENAAYNDTEIGLLPDFSIVTEAGDNNTKDNQLSNGKINDNKKNQSMTVVTVTKSDENDQDGKGEENSAKITEYCKNVTNILKLLQGAALTVLETKYITYINLFKAVVANDKSKGSKESDKSDNQEQKEEQKDDKAQQQQQEEPKKEKKGKGLFRRKKK